MENKTEQLTQSEKINISLKDIAKTIREQLKKEFPDCKFSVRTEYYSMGCSLHIYLMQSKNKIIKTYEDLTDENKFKIINYSNYTEEQIKTLQEKRYHQLANFRDEYNPDVWNNGVFLTEQGYNMFKRIQSMSDYFNWDNSDPMTDYFDVKYYLHLYIGKWDKPYNEVA